MEGGGGERLRFPRTNLKGTQLIQPVTDGDDYKRSFLRLNNFIGEKRVQVADFYVHLSSLSFGLEIVSLAVQY